MKVKTLIIAAVLTASVAGMAFAINAQIQESSSPAVQENTIKEDVIKPFRYDPEENKCTAYVYHSPNVGYYATMSEGSAGAYIDSMDGELMDCVECPVRCSAYYDLCALYGIELEENY